jgi:hypothetical protein
MSIKSIFSLRKALALMLICLLFQGVYSAAKYRRYQQDVALFVLNIEKRVALDIQKLRLANPLFNTVAHQPSIKAYIKNVNQLLIQLEAPLRLSTLQNVKTEQSYQGQPLLSNLAFTEQNIALGMTVVSWSFFSTLTPLALLLALLILVLHRLTGTTVPVPTKLTIKGDNTQIQLIIDLQNKTLGNKALDTYVTLSNKPFCFYVALIEYCMAQTQPYINQSQDIPEELLILANKYFYRLIELGHTKRKRPDFSTNLDKTLSEIRSALDTTFLHELQQKTLFYPPKAKGEGSRSKLHSYALVNLKAKHFQIIGK